MTNIAITIGDISRSAGTERAVTNLANMLAESGSYAVTVISLYSSDSSQCYYSINPEIDVVHLGFARSGMARRLIVYIKFIHSMNAIIRDKHIDVVLGTTHALNSLMLLMSREAKKIACEHMNYAACPKISGWIRKAVYPRLDAIVLLTEADSRHYDFIDSKKKWVIPNSLSFTCDNPSTLVSKRIIAIGRLARQKGFDLLIKAAVLMKKEIPDWHISIFGEGEEKSELLNLMTSFNLVDFMSIHAPIKEIQQELLSSSLFVMSSRYEGLPMVLLEAKACGLPIVSFNCPEGPAEVVRHGEDGLLVEPENIEKLAESIVSLAQNDVQLKAFGRKAFENAKMFSSQIVFDKWKALFDCVC